LLEGLCAVPGHAFWPDDIRLTDGGKLDVTRLLSFAQVSVALRRDATARAYLRVMVQNPKVVRNALDAAE
jgi:hypothetical protein